LIFITTCFIRFIKDNDEGRGWIVKTPFTTNGQNKKYAHSLEEIIKRITQQYDTLKEVLPYTMVQATMVNKKEYKIVLFKGEAQSPYPVVEPQVVGGENTASPFVPQTPNPGSCW
jgi:hypothetical protein